MQRRSFSHRYRFAIFAALFVFGSAANLRADGGDFDPAFHLQRRDIFVIATLVQPDGKIVFAGGATRFTGSSRRAIERANADGTPDATFDSGTGPDNPRNTIPFIGTIVLQPDGKILVGGEFGTFSGSAHGSVVRLNTDGSVDEGFNTSVAASGGTSRVENIVLQPDGKIIIVGGFSHYNGVPRSGIARVNNDGSLDMTFDPGNGATQVVTDAGITVGPIFTAALQGDGKIVIGGVFTKYNETPRNAVARVNADGSLDMSFDPGVSATGGFITLDSSALQPDGKILFGGDFTGFDGTSRNAIVRLNANGSLDESFNAGPLVRSFSRSSVDTMALQPDGRIVVGGAFDSVNGTNRINIARLNSDGSVDNTFRPPVGVGTTDQGGSFPVSSVKLQSDGKVVVGGGFSDLARLLPATGKISFSSNDYSVGEGAGSATITVGRSDGTDGRVVARISLTDVTTSPADYRSPAGSVDLSFDAGLGSSGFGANFPRTTAVQPDGKIVIGGAFFDYGGVEQYGIARLNADGTVDPTFVAGSGPVPFFVNVVTMLVVQADGKIVVAGNFELFDGSGNHFLERLNPDGSLDTSFHPGHGQNSGLEAMVLQPDGKILLGGPFSDYDGIPRNTIARVNTDGTLDLSFDPLNGPGGGYVFAISVQPDGRVLIGGNFKTYNGTPRSGIARLEANGLLDTSFDPGSGANATVATIALQADGRMILGGAFQTENGTARQNIARLDPNGALDLSFDPGTGVTDNGTGGGTLRRVFVQPDGRIVIAGSFQFYNGTPRRYLARLNSNGSLDSSFDPGIGASSQILTAILEPNGRIVLSGDFNSYDGAARRGIARVNGDLFVLNWESGDGSNKTFQLRIVDDALTEPNETLTLNLFPFTGAVGAGLHTTASLTILDNDGPAPMTFAAWQQGYFTSSELNDASISGDLADPDRDGLPNLLEYAFHLSPRQPSATNRPYSVIDATYFSLVYTKTITATDLTYIVERSFDLMSWSPVALVNLILADDGITQTVKAQVMIMGGSQMYLRLRVAR